MVAVFRARPVAAWRLRGAFYRGYTRDGQRRCALSLGDPLPLLPEYDQIPGLRSGAAIRDLPVDPLPDEMADD